MKKLASAVKALSSNDVEYVIVGGVAIRIHSSSYSTVDLDFCYSRTKDNLQKLVKVLSPFNPRPRDFPKNLPFIFDERTLQNGTNFTFETEIGDIDLLGEVAGIGLYPDVKANSVIFEIHGYEVNILTVDGLIRAKRAAGRPKDMLVLPELEALQETLKRSGE